MSWKEGDAEHGGIETCPVERGDPGLPRDAGIRHTIKSVSSKHAGGKGFVLKVTLVMLRRPQPLGRVRGLLGLTFVTHGGCCRVFRSGGARFPGAARGQL